MINDYNIRKIKEKYNFESSYFFDVLSLFELYYLVELNELKNNNYCIKIRSKKLFYEMINKLKKKHYNIQFLKNINNQFFCKIYKN